MDLRRRLALALTALPVAITALFAAGIWLVYLKLESQTLDRVLGRELEVFIQAHAAPSANDAALTGLRYYRPALAEQPPLPPELAQLAPGSYRDFSTGGGSRHVMVRDVAPGDRAY